MTVPAPALFPDELVYSELARSFAAGGHFELRGVGVSPWAYGPLYPMLIAPAYLIRDLATAYAVVQAINAVLISTAAVPAYLLARPVVSRRGALLVAAATVLVPSTIYATRVMAESLAYPAFLWALVAMTAALDRPSHRRQLIALGAIVIAALSRGALGVLLPTFAASIVLWAWMQAPHEGSCRTRLRSFAPTWIATVVAAVLGVVAFASGSIGAYGAVVADLRLWMAPAKVLWHVADLDLYSGVIPFAAFVVVSWTAVRAKSTDRSVRIFTAVAVSSFAALIVLAGVYTTAFDHVFDRYVFYVVPLFFIALVGWIERGLSGSRRLIAGVAALAVVLPLTLPFGSLLNGHEWGTSTSSVGLVPWVWVAAFVGKTWVLRLAVLLFAAALGLAFLRTRGGEAWSLIRIPLMLLVIFGLIVSVSNGVISHRSRDKAGRNTLTWVDAAVGPGSTVAVLWRGRTEDRSPEQVALREAEFFNRTVGAVYDLRDELVAGVPSTHVAVDGDFVVGNGGRRIRAKWVLAGPSAAVEGRPFAHDARSKLVLYRVHRFLRVRGGAAR
jgi:hypothetical protein